MASTALKEAEHLYENYFDSFFSRQRQKVKDKIIWTFDLIEQLDVVPETYLKHLEGTDTDFVKSVSSKVSDIFRIFCFLDEGKLVVLVMAFKKRRKRHQVQKFKRQRN